MSDYVQVHPDAPEVAVDIDFTNNPTTEQRNWESVSDRLRELHVRTYRATELDEFQVATMTAVLDNSDRALEPGYAGSPWYPNASPRRPIRYRAKWNGVEYERFWGFTNTHPIQWPSQVDAVSVITASDIAMLLNRDQVLLNGYPLETVDDRINRALDEIGVPASVRAIDTSDTYVAAVAEIDEDAGVQPIVVGALQHCQDAARSDGGYFFVARDGTVTFHNRYHRRDVLGTPAMVFGDANDGSEVPYRPDLVGTVDDVRLWNQAAVLTSAGVREEASNAFSISRFWRSRRDDFQSLLEYDGDAAARASLYVWRYAQEEPALRFPRLTVKALDIEGADLAGLLEADVGTRFQIIRRPEDGGDAIDREAHVEGITEDIAVNGATWELSYDVSPADPDIDVWILGTSELAFGDDFEDGELDTDMWTLTSDADVDFAEETGAAQFVIDSGGNGGWSGIASVETTLDLTGRQFVVEIEEAQPQDANAQALIFFKDDGTHYLAWRLQGGNLDAVRNTGSGDLTVGTAVYKPALHRWVRFREQSGTTYWETAPSRNGVWEEIAAVSNPVTVTSGQIDLEAGGPSAPAADVTVRYGWAGIVNNASPAVVGY